MVILIDYYLLFYYSNGYIFKINHYNERNIKLNMYIKTLTLIKENTMIIFVLLLLYLSCCFILMYTNYVGSHIRSIETH